MKLPLLFSLGVLLCSSPARADWPTVRGNTHRSGTAPAELKEPFGLRWATYFTNERLGTAVEPIVADGKLFVGTHQGNLYALDAASGQASWRVTSTGAFLHSPAYERGTVVAANAAGQLLAVDAATGKLRWCIQASPLGFAASPAILNGTVLIGSRSGEFLAVELTSGRVLWRKSFDVPIRQTAAVAQGKVYVTAEDLRVRRLDVASGNVEWTSEPLYGQTVRDGFPVVIEDKTKTYLLIVTNPVIQMSRLIGLHREWLTRSAGLGNPNWKDIEKWINSPASVGDAERFANEQKYLREQLAQRPDSRTLYVLDAATGKEGPAPPVLWCGGCQGLPSAPTPFPDGKLLIFGRSAFGNWTHGVAPLVALGKLDLESNSIEWLRHKQGVKPPWNTFWGTADEAQSFTIVGERVLIVHQGTLSSFDPRTQTLSPIWGNRDTYGGFNNLPWARNEWHGPARSGIAVVGGRIYWQTGSRLLCLESATKGKAADVAIDGAKVPTQAAPDAELPTRDALQQRLQAAVMTVLERTWQPLYVEPGLAGREFFFAQSGESFQALAAAYPHLSAEMQKKIRSYLAERWEKHFPLDRQTAWLSLTEGQPREWFTMPRELRTEARQDRRPHPFGNLAAVRLYAENCGEWERVRAAWPRIKASYADWQRTNWKLDLAKGDRWANRYLGALLALSQIAHKFEDREVADKAEAQAKDVAAALVGWWKRSAERADLRVLRGSQELDPFLSRGDALFFAVMPHQAKLALFADLTPEVAALVKRDAPEAVEKIWKMFEALCPTWHLVGEEHQVHTGENFVDPPDFALSGFLALKHLKGAAGAEMVKRLDGSAGRADLAELLKLALALDAR